MRYQVIIKVIPNKKHFTVSVTIFFTVAKRESNSKIIYDILASVQHQHHNTKFGMISCV